MMRQFNNNDDINNVKHGQHLSNNYVWLIINFNVATYEDLHVPNLFLKEVPLLMMYHNRLHYHLMDEH